MKMARSFLVRVGVVMACAGGFAFLGAGSVEAGPAAAGVVPGGGGAVVGAGGAHASAPAIVAGASMGAHVGTSSVGRPANLVSTGSSYVGGVAPHAASGGLTTSRAGQPAIFPPTRPGVSTTPVMPLQGSNPAPVAVPGRPHNAWTDPATSGTSRTPGARHHDNHFSGTILYPDAYRDVTGNRFGLNNGYPDRRGGQFSRFRFHRRGYYDSYGYYSPYGVYGGYTPYVYNDIAGVGTTANDYAGSVGDSNDLSTDAAGNLARPYPTESAVMLPRPSDATAAPEPPAPQTNANPNLKSNAGPDSLVEAVQAELARRGYFGGKVDAVYNEATHAALQRFQSDQQLAVTGRINEATLHALQLD